MAAANITLSVEPSQNGKVTCLALAPGATMANGEFQISLRVQFVNNQSAPVQVSSVTLSFPGSAVPARTYPLALGIGAGQTAFWPFQTSDNLVAQLPLPETMNISVQTHGFSPDKVTTVPLAFHVSPTPQGSFRFWGDPAELQPGEFWVGEAAVHGSGVNATQIFAYDVGVEVYDGKGTDQGWNGFLPGTDGSKNEHARIWGKSIHAVADGVVAAFRNDFPTNAAPGTVDPSIVQQINAVGDGNGNFFCIQSGEEIVLYAHMQPGTLNASLLSTGAQVQQGIFLGRAGNAGSSSGPHLHIHSNQANAGPQFWVGAPRPFPLHGGQVLGRDRLTAQRGFGPWVTLNGRGFPPERSMVWPVDNSWESLGGTLTSGPAVASWSEGRLDVFVRATDNSLYHRYWNGSQWSEWQGHGGALASSPAAVSWGNNRIDVFARQLGTDALIHLYWNGSNWSQWEPLGGTLTSGPAVASWGEGRLDVFVRATDNSLYHRYWNGSQWSDWQGLGGALASDPAAVSWGGNRIDVFAQEIGTGALIHLYWNGSAWSKWESLGGTLASGPAAASRGSNRLDVFVRATDGSLYQKLWDGSRWSEWQALGGQLFSDPAAVAWNSNRLDVFARGGDDTLRHAWWDGQNWRP